MITSNNDSDSPIQWRGQKEGEGDSLKEQTWDFRGIVS